MSQLIDNDCQRGQRYPTRRVAKRSPSPPGYRVVEVYWCTTCAAWHARHAPIGPASAALERAVQRLEERGLSRGGALSVLLRDERLRDRTAAEAWNAHRSDQVRARCGERICHTSREAAEKFRGRKGDRFFEAYLCPRCGTWHLRPVTRTLLARVAALELDNFRLNQRAELAEEALRAAEARERRLLSIIKRGAAGVGEQAVPAPPASHRRVLPDGVGARGSGDVAAHANSGSADLG